MTRQVYQDKLVQKLTVFNFINAYTALFYAVFVPAEWWFLRGTCTGAEASPGSGDTPKNATCFADLRFNLAIIFTVSVFTSNFVQTVLGYVKYFVNYVKESRGLARGHEL